MRPIALTLLGLLAVGCCPEHRAYDLEFELRVPSTEQVPLPSKFAYVETAGCRGTGSLTTDDFADERPPRDENSYHVYADKTLIFSGYRKRALFFSMPGRPTQAFVLPIPAMPETGGDWTPWVDPTYVEEPSAPSPPFNYLWEQENVPGRSTTLPADHFQLRYRSIRNTWVESANKR